MDLTYISYIYIYIVTLPMFLIEVDKCMYYTGGSVGCYIIALSGGECKEDSQVVKQLERPLDRDYSLYIYVFLFILCIVTIIVYTFLLYNCYSST